MPDRKFRPNFPIAESLVVVVFGLLIAGCANLPFPGNATSSTSSTSAATDEPPPVQLGMDLSPEQTERYRTALIGTWFRSQPIVGGGTDSEISVFREDGSYVFSFQRKNAVGQVTDEVSELGSWGISGDIHFTITLAMDDHGRRIAVNPADADNYLAYRVLELNDAVFAYQTVVTGNVFRLNRVENGFRFPE